MYFLWAGYLETQKAKGVVIIVSSHNCSLAYNITMPPVPLALQTVVVASLVGNEGIYGFKISVDHRITGSHIASEVYLQLSDY